MFEHSFVEISSEMKKRKRWTALVSYAVELMAVGILLSFPLLHSEALPLDERPIFHPPTHYVPDHVQIVETSPTRRPTQRQQVMVNPYLAPQSIPKGIHPGPDPMPPGPVVEGPLIPGSIPGGGDEHGTRTGLESVLRPMAPMPIHRPSLAVRSSQSQESLLIRQIKPMYPPLALQTRVQGPVVLQATIARNGSIEQLHVVSGHPLLVRAAVEAVQQWRYRPYFLNGEAVEVETQITVNFTLNGD